MQKGLRNFPNLPKMTKSNITRHIRIQITHFWREIESQGLEKALDMVLDPENHKKICWKCKFCSFGGSLVECHRNCFKLSISPRDVQVAGGIQSSTIRTYQTLQKHIIFCVFFWIWCLDLSVGCFELSFACLDLSSECLELSVGCLELSFGCLELSDWWSAKSWAATSCARIATFNHFGDMEQPPESYHS